jgi:hypothetical protein
MNRGIGLISLLGFVLAVIVHALLPLSNIGGRVRWPVNPGAPTSRAPVS